MQAINMSTINMSTINMTTINMTTINMTTMFLNTNYCEFNYELLYEEYMAYNSISNYFFQLLLSIGFFLVIAINYLIEPLKKKQPIIISIEGNIGTGKSTLIEKVQQHFINLNTHFNNDYIPKIIKIGYIPEPVNVWNSVTDNEGVTILEKYYENQQKYAFPFQMMAYISRLAIMRENLKKDYDVIIMERSIFTDREVFAKMLYDDKKIEQIEYNIYMKWFNEFIGDFPNIRHIYIQAEPKVSAARVSKRGRVGETIPLSYLEACHAYHEDWLLENQLEPILLLDGNTDLDDSDYDEWLEKIGMFIIGML